VFFNTLIHLEKKNKKRDKRDKILI
jgi:hypothetical protein